jgi:farnesyl-diphosphate farnesyltransferase
MTENADQILRDVSRSFYLSIRALPRALREPVSLAYLLARATDTIADTAGEVARRVELLDKFAAAITSGESNVAEIGDLLEAPEKAGVAMTEGERKLLTHANLFLQELVDQPANDRADIRALLGIITRGQRLDLTRWSDSITALATANQLREYTYFVAGCVGEFWTRLCFRKVSGFSARGEKDMTELARKYGSGLQLVNILRDAGDDLRRGRCYFPEEELRETGLSVTQVVDAPAEFLRVYQRWIAEARDGLDAGLEYCIAIEPPRVRIATVLPALIGVRTLELLEQKGLAVLRDRVKVPRAEIHKIMASAAITLANRSRLRSRRARL